MQAELEQAAREKADASETEARARIAERERQIEETGRKPGGRAPRVPDPETAVPDAKAQRNFTDPNSRAPSPHRMGRSTSRGGDVTGSRPASMAASPAKACEPVASDALWGRRRPTALPPTSGGRVRAAGRLRCLRKRETLPLPDKRRTASPGRHRHTRSEIHARLAERGSA